MKRLLFLFPLLISAQVTTIPNTTFPAVRSMMNGNFLWLNTNKAGVSACPANQYAIQTTTAGVVCASLTSGQLTTALGFTPASTDSPTFTGTVTIGGTVLVNCAGVDDTAALQALIGTGGKRLLFSPGASCVLSSSLIVKPNTWLDLGTATLSMPAGGDNLIRNGAASRSVTDAAITSGQRTLTSATASFTAADLWRTVKVTGANAGGIDLWTDIVSVTNGTTVVLRKAAAATVSGAAATVWVPDTNITITGGTITRAGALGAYHLGNLLSFRHVNGLTIRDVNTVTTVGHIAVSLGDVTNANITGLNIQGVIGQPGQDGIHIQGPTRNVVVSNIRGMTGDDLLAITSRDWAGYDDTYGDVAEITYSNIVGASTEACLLKIEGAPGAYIDNIIATNLTGAQKADANGVAGANYGVCIRNADHGGTAAMGRIKVDNVGGYFNHEALLAGPQGNSGLANLAVTVTSLTGNAVPIPALRDNILGTQNTLVTPWATAANGTITAEVAATDPFGGGRVSKYTAGNQAYSCLVRYSYNFTGSTGYTCKVWAKKGNGTYINFRCGSQGLSSTKDETFNLDTGAWTTSYATHSATAYPNGWWLLSVTGTQAGGATPVDIGVCQSTADGQTNYTPVGTEYVYLFHPHVTLP